jgi:(p)ppGpp synthase/HD superfamily hydrolase
MKQREAELFADIGHTQVGQKRKYTNDPYIYHPRNVAYLVQVVGGTDEMISAAFLHDVLEDVAPKYPGQFGEGAIRKAFGDEILELVKWLTDVSKPEDGNRDVRKKIDRDHTAAAPAQAKTIKLADLIDNSLSICEHDPGFARIYLKEKRLLLDVLRDGDKNLWDIANNILIRNGY